MDVAGDSQSVMSENHKTHAYLLFLFHFHMVLNAWTVVLASQGQRPERKGTVMT